jgi:hypothetical protein
MEFSRAVSPRRLILAGLGLSVVLIIVAVTASLLPGTPGAPGTPGSGAGPSASPPAAASTLNPIEPITSPSDAPADITPSTPEPVGPRTTTEVQQGATPVVTLPPSPAAGPLVSGPLPASATSTGALVVGFPSVIPLPSGNTIATSSVLSSGNHLQATLSATTPVDTAELVNWFSLQFAKLRLPGSPVPAVGGSTAYAFARGDDSITLTVTPATAGGSHYTLLGNFAAVAG